MAVLEVAVFLQYIMFKFIFLIKFNFLWMEFVNVSLWYQNLKYKYTVF
jgi:hypothetical protein